MFLLPYVPWIIGVVLGIILISVLISTAKAWRIVVPANEVHIVQRGKTSTSYGSGQIKGNVFWMFPHWIPGIGTAVSVMPVSIFQIDLDEYEAYDQEKVPFAVDVISFFQIEDPVQAAKRASDHGELRNQLQNVLRGSVRKILASKELSSIMETRSELNSTFLAEVLNQVKAWGVHVISIEFTDIHDAEGTKVISNIMNKKKSKIEMESRVEVAENLKVAQIKEIEARQAAEVRATEAQEAVETRNAERTKKVGIAEQQSAQQVQEETRITKEKEVAVEKAGIVGAAQYKKEEALINAEANAAAQVATSKGNSEKAKIEAEGYRNAQLLKAEGDAKLIGETGRAEAEVIQAKAVAAAEGQLKQAEALAKIQKDGLQAQLGEKAIEAHRAIGVAIAAAYEKADIKAVLTNGGGIESLGDLLTTGGGGKLGAFIEALKSVSGGANVLEALGIKNVLPKPIVPETPKTDTTK